MPLTIQRTASVYQLWVDMDLRACFTDHAALGWVCTLVAAKQNDTVVWAVRMQLGNGAATQVVAAGLDDVIVSDGTTVVSQTVNDYNAANQNNPIGGS